MRTLKQREISPSKKKGENRNCPVCGNRFYAMRCEIKKNKGKYCSKKCFNISLKGRSHQMQMKGENQKCLFYGKEFYARRCDIKKGKGKYCSRECFGINRKNRPRQNVLKITKICETCGNDFHVKPSKSLKRRFCSMKCFGAKIKKICIICQKEFEVQRNQDKIAKYCSRKCHAIEQKSRIGYWAGKKRPNLKLPQHWKPGKDHPYWKGGKYRLDKKTRHSYEYAEWRKIVIERDKKCVICGSYEKLQVDHIKSFRSFPELRFDINNGRVLCFNCHRKTPSYGFFPKKEGFYDKKQIV
mgnify:CR=1 FL=1